MLKRPRQVPSWPLPTLQPGLPYAAWLPHPALHPSIPRIAPFQIVFHLLVEYRRRPDRIHPFRLLASSENSTGRCALPHQGQASSGLHPHWHRFRVPYRSVHRPAVYRCESRSNGAGCYSYLVPPSLLLGIPPPVFSSAWPVHRIALIGLALSFHPALLIPPDKHEMIAS